MTNSATGVMERLASYLAITRSEETSLKNQVVSGVARAAAAGVLRVGEQLPPAVQLARRLNIGTGTVVKAYGRLEELGVLRAVQGVGSYVESDANARTFAVQMIRGKIADAVREAQEVQFSEDALADIVSEEMRRVYEVAS